MSPSKLHTCGLRRLEEPSLCHVSALMLSVCLPPHTPERIRSRVSSSTMTSKLSDELLTVVFETMISAEHDSSKLVVPLMTICKLWKVRRP
jgi:hypothetical protein